MPLKIIFLLREGLGDYGKCPVSTPGMKTLPSG